MRAAEAAKTRDTQAVIAAQVRAEQARIAEEQRKQGG